MECKTIELRDRATFIPMLAIRLIPGCEADRYLIARAGFGREATSQGQHVIFVRLQTGSGSHDPYEHGNTRTFGTAHQYLLEHWDEVETGAVIDVEVLLGEKTTPKQSERLTAAMY